MEAHRSRPSTAVGAVLAAAVVFAVPAAATAQGVSESLGLLAQENARLYLAPVFEGLGASLGNGFSDDASAHDRFGFDVGVRVMGAFVPEEAEVFQAIPPEVTYQGNTYSYVASPSDGSLSTPTAVGAGTGVTLVPDSEFESALIASGEDPTDYHIPFPQGYDVPAVPFVVLQGSLGIGFNTELSVRAIPSVEANEDVGSVEAFGFGGMHEVSGWFPAFPVDLSVTAGYQDFSVNEYLDASTTSIGLMVGRSFGALDVFAVGENVSPQVDVSYTVENEDDNPALPADGTVIRFDPDLPSETRLGIGANLHFLLMNLSVQYSTGDYDVATAKLGFSFR